MIWSLRSLLIPLQSSPLTLLMVSPLLFSSTVTLSGVPSTLPSPLTQQLHVQRANVVEEGLEFVGILPSEEVRECVRVRECTLLVSRTLSSLFSD